MNRRPTRKEANYYGVLPAHAELVYQVHLHRDGHEYQFCVKYRSFTWTEPGGSLHELEMRHIDDEIRGFGGSPYPAPLDDMTPELWDLHMHRRHDPEIAAARAAGWTADLWVVAPEPLTLF